MISSNAGYNINISAVNNTLIQTNSSTVIAVGTYMASNIGTMFSLGA